MHFPSMIEAISKDRPRNYIADCDECNAQIEFTQQDVQCTKGYAPTAYVVCPDCGHYIAKKYFTVKKN